MKTTATGKKINRYTNRQSGLSLVETLVAITLLLVALVGPMTIAARSLQTAIFAQEQTAAFYLAQEGLELVFDLRTSDALTALNGGDGDTWNWRPNNCGGDSTSAAQLCGLDTAGVVVDCSSDSTNCQLYDMEASTKRYQHDDSGTELPFTRTVLIDMDGTAADVTSTVTWTSSLFGQERSVVAETYIYDIYNGF